MRQTKRSAAHEYRFGIIAPWHNLWDLLPKLVFDHILPALSWELAPPFSTSQGSCGRQGQAFDGRVRRELKKKKKFTQEMMSVSNIHSEKPLKEAFNKRGGN